jgi:organic radical activating enzyme
VDSDAVVVSESVVHVAAIIMIVVEDTYTSAHVECTERTLTNHQTSIEMEYIKGRSNLACTIFIPVKCGNNCPFCNTRSMYNDYVYSKETMERIKSWIRVVNDIDFISEFVITGGEPLIDLKVLKSIVSTCRKPVYINTSLPNVPHIEEAIEYINTKKRIEGVNISRHISHKHEVQVCGVDMIERIKKPVRINCLVTENNFSIDAVERLIDVYASEYRMINLRADYRTINDLNLKTQDVIFKQLLEHYRFEGANACLVCNSQFFSKDERYVICYHRGVENSAVRTQTRTYVNDVIIDIHGNIYCDWNMVDEPEFREFLNNT